MRQATPPGRWAFALALALSATATAARAEGPPSMARYIPREDLVVFAEFDGLDAHADAWNRTAAAKILDGTTAGAMLEAMIAQVAERRFAEAGASKLSGPEFLLLVKHALHSGFALSINKPPGARKPTCVALVIRGAARGEVRPLLDRMIAASAEGSATETAKAAGGRDLHVVRPPKGPGWAWWAEGDDLAFSLVTPEGADAMLAALDGKSPDAVGHPTRAALARVEDGFLPIGLAFFDVVALPPLPPKAMELGMEGVQRLEFRWGVQDEALMTVTRLVVPAPRRGVLAIFDQPTFDAKSLPPTPRGQVGRLAFSSDLPKLLDALGKALEAGGPGRGPTLKQVEEMLRQATGHDLRADLLKHVGPKVSVYVVPERVVAPTNPLTGFAAGMLHVTRGALIAEVDDPEALARVLDDLAARANAALKRQAEVADSPAPEFRALKGPEKGFELRLPPGTFPLPAGSRPTLILGKTHLALGTTPEVAGEALAAASLPAERPAEGSALARAMDRLPSGMTFLSVADARESLLPELLANLPALIEMVGSGRGGAGFFGPLFRPAAREGPGLRFKIDPDLLPSAGAIREQLFPATYALAVDAAGLRFLSREAFPSANPASLAPVALAAMLPAVQASRAAARRSQSVNNLKQIGLAMHNFHSTQDHFPPQATRDKDGKPLLSWRVAILPFLEQQALFQEFHQDEPWDSPHNLELVARMPMVYAVPGVRAQPGHTFYRGFAGKGTIYDPEVKEGVGIAQITDGTSNTIAIVEAREAVPWTKPDDIEFDPEAKPADGPDPLLKLLGSHFSGGFNALIADGSVRFLRLSINPQTLRAMITRDGGEVISADQF